MPRLEVPPAMNVRAIMPGTAGMMVVPRLKQMAMNTPVIAMRTR